MIISSKVQLNKIFRSLGGQFNFNLKFRVVFKFYPKIILAINHFHYVQLLKKKKISFSLFSIVKIITFLSFLSISMSLVQASPSPWQIRRPKCLSESQYHYQIKQHTAHLWVPNSVIDQLSKSEQNSYQFTKVNLGPNNIHLHVQILGCGPILQNT